MTWKFRPDFKVMPGIYLKYGSSGIQTQIQSAGVLPDDTEHLANKLKYQLFKPYQSQHEIKSASIDLLTSKELKEFKSLLLASGEAFSGTNALLTYKMDFQSNLSRKIQKLQGSIFKFLFKKKIARKEHELQLLTEEIAELNEQRELSVVRLEIESDDVYINLYKTIKKAFEILSQCEKKWDFTSSKSTNRIVERTSASSTITRSEIVLSERSLPIIHSNEMPLCFHNMNGGDVYLYPGFLIVYESKSDFAVVSYTDVSLIFAALRFIESDKVPDDTVILDRTWYKVNKDGTPDKRFASNYQIPVVKYGEIHFSSSSGLNEVFCFSNAERAMIFQKAFADYVDTLKNAKSLINTFNKK